MCLHSPLISQNVTVKSRLSSGTKRAVNAKFASAGEGSSRAVYSSDNPTSILQPVPAWRSAVWNLSLLCGSIAILLIVVIQWPVSALLRWKYRQPSTRVGKELLVTRVLRVTALIDVVYLLAWIATSIPEFEQPHRGLR